MSFKLCKQTQALALGFIIFASPALACDKPASTDRIAKVVSTGEMQRPTRVSEGFAAEVTEKFWAGADDKQKDALAADIACAIDADTVSFTRDRSVLKTYRSGKPQ